MQKQNLPPEEKEKLHHRIRDNARDPEVDPITIEAMAHAEADKTLPASQPVFSAREEQRRKYLRDKEISGRE